MEYKGAGQDSLVDGVFLVVTLGIFVRDGRGKTRGNTGRTTA